MIFRRELNSGLLSWTCIWCTRRSGGERGWSAVESIRVGTGLFLRARAEFEKDMTSTDVLESRLARVHLNCKGRPPRHPGTGWTRFVCISDTHSRRFDVPSGDVLVHAGDLSYYSTNLSGTIEWLKTLDHPFKM
jgi:hypothetical protein